MAANVTGPDFDAHSHQRGFSRTRVVGSVVLLALFVVFIAFSWWTRDALAHVPSGAGQKGERGTGPGSNAIVDLRPWQTAQSLAALAVTAEETEYAREAERLADHAVDQAFASALRQATAQHTVLTGAALSLANKVQSLQQLVKDDQARVRTLTKAGGRDPSPERKGAADLPALAVNDLDVAQAQLGLDSDELTDAQQDLARAVGDQRGKIQQELAAHEASMRKYDASVGKENPPAVLSTQRYGTLARRLQAWVDQRSRQQLLQQAITQTEADVRALTVQHNMLLSQANAAIPATARTASPSATDALGSAPDRAAEVDSMHKQAAQRQLLSIYDDRIQTEQQLAAVYGKVGGAGDGATSHPVSPDPAVLGCDPFILICVVLVDAVLQRVMERPTLDSRRTQTLRKILQLAVQVAGAILSCWWCLAPRGRCPLSSA